MPVRAWAQASVAQARGVKLGCEAVGKVGHRRVAGFVTKRLLHAYPAGSAGGLNDVECVNGATVAVEHVKHVGRYLENPEHSQTMLDRPAENHPLTESVCSDIVSEAITLAPGAGARVSAQGIAGVTVHACEPTKRECHLSAS
jgi:hypothetical protein